MATPNTPSPIVAVQVVLVRREGDKETLQSVDIPIRNPLNADIELVTDERGINLAVNVMNDPRYCDPRVDGLLDHGDWEPDDLGYGNPNIFICTEYGCSGCGARNCPTS